MRMRRFLSRASSHRKMLEIAMKITLVLSVVLCHLLLSYNAASPATVLPPVTAGSGGGEGGNEGPTNRAPPTTHSLRVVTGVSASLLIALLLLVCLTVGRTIRDRCDSASYPVQELESCQRQRGPPTTVFINPVVDERVENGAAADGIESTVLQHSQPTLGEMMRATTLHPVEE